MFSYYSLPAMYHVRFTDGCVVQCVWSVCVPSSRRGRAPGRAAVAGRPCFPARSSSTSPSPEDPAAPCGTETGEEEEEEEGWSVTLFSHSSS